VSRREWTDDAGTQPAVFNVLWQRPAIGERALSTQPVFPGDILRVKSTAIDKRQSRSRPESSSVFPDNESITGRMKR